MNLYLLSFDLSMPESNSRKRSAAQGDGCDPWTSKKEGAPRRVDGIGPPRGSAREGRYFFFRNGRPVRLFTMTFLPGGISVGFPDFGFFLLKK